MTKGGGGRGVGITTHAHWAFGSLFTGCVLLEVTGRKGECAHAWAPPSLGLRLPWRRRGALPPESGSASSLHLALAGG